MQAEPKPGTGPLHASVTSQSCMLHGQLCDRAFMPKHRSSPARKLRLLAQNQPESVMQDAGSYLHRSWIAITSCFRDSKQT